eukprot:4372802-Lingulodinium_polyedra.AAC.1
MAQAIPAKDLGDDVGCLTPAGVTQLSLQGAPAPSALQTAGRCEKGLPPPQDKSPFGEEGSGSGSRDHKPTGSE